MWSLLAVATCFPIEGSRVFCIVFVSYFKGLCVHSLFTNWLDVKRHELLFSHYHRLKLMTLIWLQKNAVRSWSETEPYWWAAYQRETAQCHFQGRHHGAWTFQVIKSCQIIYLHMRKKDEKKRYSYLCIYSALMTLQIDHFHGKP